MITSEWIAGNGDLSVPLALRRRVFVDELRFDGALDRDALDDYAMHLVLFDDGKPVATGRIAHDGKRFVLGKICTLPEARGQHVGDLLTRLLIYKACQFAETLYIRARLPVAPFYARYGFCEEGEAFDVQGQAHVWMCVKKRDVVFPSACGGHHDCTGGAC